MLKQKNKRVLNLGEVAEYIGFAKSYIYKLTSKIKYILLTKWQSLFFNKGD